MPTDDPVEQLDSASLDPEDSHTIADFRPLGIQIGLDEILAEVADMQLGTTDIAPFDGSAARQGDGAVQLHRLAREQPEMVGGLFHGNYPGGTGLMSGAVFGRLAGAHAAKA